MSDVKTTKSKIIDGQIPIKKIPVFLAFLNFFIYGGLLLMVGYTQPGLSKILFTKDTSTYMTYLLLSGVVGIFVVFALKNILKKVDIKYIFTISYALVAISLLLIALISTMAPAAKGGIDGYAGQINVKGIILFIIFSMFMGASMAPQSPLVVTYLGAVFKGNAQTKAICVGNGAYGIGAGIIPLTASSFVVNQGAKDFAAVRYYYFIAVGFAIVGAIAGWFISYRHSTQSLSKHITKEGKMGKNFPIWSSLSVIVAIMCFYMISETVANYMFANLGNAYSDNLATKVRVTQAFGLFVMVQGIWRAVSGLWVVPKLNKGTFLLGSSVFMLTGIIMLVSGMMRPVWGPYVIAIFFAIGYGSMWPVIYVYGMDLDQRRNQFIGFWLNIISGITIPATQLLNAILWTNLNNPGTISVGTLAPMFLALIATVLMIIGLIIYIPLIKRLHKKHDIKLEQ